MGNEVKIDKGIPIPPPYSGTATGGQSAVLLTMDIGDSIFFPGDLRTSNSRRASARVQGRRHGKSFVTRTVTENGVKGVRIWRIE